jgi:hypothetical protein
MSETMMIDFRDPKIVREVGLAALKKELGSVGTAYFIRQYDRGKGNYTQERGEMVERLTHDEVLEGIKNAERIRSQCRVE